MHFHVGMDGVSEGLPEWNDDDDEQHNDARAVLGHMRL